MEISASTLRQNIYKFLDQVLESGVPLKIKRKGKILTILPPESVDKFKRLKKRKGLKCEPEEIVKLNWTKEWKPFI